MANQKPKELATKKTSAGGTTKAPTVSKKTSKKVSKQVTKIAKRNPIALFVAAGFLVVGAAAGFIVTKNDTFKVVNYNYEHAIKNVEGKTAKELFEDIEDKDAVLFANETYYELGTECKFLGSDLTSKVSVEYFYREDISFDEVKVEKVDTSVTGYYYACYKVDHFRYKDVELIRNIIVVEVEANG